MPGVEGFKDGHAEANVTSWPWKILGLSGSPCSLTYQLCVLGGRTLLLSGRQSPHL